MRIALAIVRAYIKNILVAVDRLVSAMLGLDPDRTISWHCGWAVANSRPDGVAAGFVWTCCAGAAPLVDLIMLPFDGKNHCLRVYQHGEDMRAAWRIIEAHEALRRAFKASKEG